MVMEPRYPPKEAKRPPPSPAPPKKKHELNSLKIFINCEMIEGISHFEMGNGKINRMSLIDYRQLLRKYMGLVCSMEGITFVSEAGTDQFSDDEIKALKEIEKIDDIN